MQTLYTSGTVFHAFLGEKLPDWQAAANLVRKIAENYKLPYYTLSPTYSICKNHGYIAGEHFSCPDCGEQTEVYSRITGYYRPVRNWNAGKTEEYKERKVYAIDEQRAVHGKKEENARAKIGCAGLSDGLYLFTSKTCPNCRMAKSVLDKAGVSYAMIDAEEQAELTKKLGVQSAPTLLIVKNGEAQLIENVSNIKKYTLAACA